MIDNHELVFELGTKGYSCGQILLAGALRILQEEDIRLIRAMSGLSQGGGNTGRTCGALTGGFCLLSMYSGKGKDFESALELEKVLWDELEHWFNDEFSVNHNNANCNAILEIKEDESEQNISRIAKNPQKCAQVISKTFDKCIELLQSHEVDFLKERD